MGNCCFKCDEQKTENEISSNDRRKTKNIVKNTQVVKQSPAPVNLLNESASVTNERPRIKNQNSSEIFKDIERQNAERGKTRKQKECANAEEQREAIKKQNATQLHNPYLEERKWRGEHDLCKGLENLTVKSSTQVVKNTEMIDELLMAIKRPSYYSNSIYHLENVDQFSSEYQRVQGLFKATNKRCFTVQKIDKVNNPYLLLQYSLKKWQHTAKYGTHIEQELFHGTRKCNIASICTNNFNWRLRGTSKGHKFGQGISFTPISNYATHYGDDGYDKVMFLVKVIVVSKCLGNQYMEVPPNHYDTTTNEQEHVIVKYEDNDYYPAYLIYYGGVDMNKNNRRGGRGGYRGRYTR